MLPSTQNACVVLEGNTDAYADRAWRIRWMHTCTLYAPRMNDGAMAINVPMVSGPIPLSTCAQSMVDQIAFISDSQVRK